MGVGVQTGKNPYGERVWRVPGSKHFSILGENSSAVGSVSTGDCLLIFFGRANFS